MKYCPHCNSLDFNEDSMYCSQCGYNLNENPRGSNNQQINKRTREKISKSAVLIEIGIIFVFYTFALVFLFDLFGFGVFIFMFPIFITLIGLSAKMASYQLSPQEMTNESIYKENMYDPFFENNGK